MITVGGIYERALNKTSMVAYSLALRSLHFTKESEKCGLHVCLQTLIADSYFKKYLIYPCSEKYEIEDKLVGPCVAYVQNAVSIQGIHML